MTIWLCVQLIAIATIACVCGMMFYRILEHFFPKVFASEIVRLKKENALFRSAFDQKSMECDVLSKANFEMSCLLAKPKE